MIGRSVLHYRITAELGAGAMGRVYLATDTRTERRVALKFPGGATDAEGRERFLREARAAARLQHAGIVTLLAAEEVDGEPFLVQEFVEGVSLGGRLARGPLGAEQTLALARELSAALAHAHAHGVLHRDLKPENVLVAADGHFKIADFGIARLEGAPTLTAPGTFMGSLPYAAPERVRGNSGDARADLFALGAILYEAIGGRRAFPGASEAEVMYQILNEDPAPLAPASARLAPLADLALRLLAKDPAQRPGSADIVSGMLEGMEAGATASTPTPAGAPTTAAAAASTATPRWLVPAIALAVVVMALLAWWSMPGRVANAAGNALAVIYFENMTDPVDAGRMGAITGNLLVTSLAQREDLNVLSSQRVLEAMHQLGRSGRPVDRTAALEIARRVSASRIVTGSILQHEPFIVMTAEISDARSGRVIDAVRVEGQPGQTVFQVVDALGQRLLARVSPAVEGTRLTPVAQRASSDLEAVRRYVHGLDHFAHGDLSAAEREFRAAVERDPAFAQALYELALVRWWMGEPGEAKAYVERAERLADRLSPLEQATLGGLRALVDSRWKEGADRFADAERRWPEEKLLVYGRVEAAYHDEDFPATIEAGRRALALDSTFTVAGIHLVDALRRTGRYDEAEAVAERLLARAPRNEALWSSLMTTRVVRGDGPGALRAARDAFEVLGPSERLLAGAMRLLVNADSLEAARRLATRSELDPRVRLEMESGTRYAIAVRSGRMREAERIARRAWAERRSHAFGVGADVPLANGFDAAVALRDRAGALTFSDSAMARMGRWGVPEAILASRLVRAYLLASLGDTAGAQHEFEASERSGALAVSRVEKFARVVRARILGARGRPAEGLAAIAGGAYPGPPELQESMSRVPRAQLELGAGLYVRALGTLDTLAGAPMIAPSDAARIPLWRGQALEKLGRRDEAIASYRAFLHAWKEADHDLPELAQARAALARLERAPQTAGGTR
jgi:serine/threonine-protein kinase